MAFPSGFSQGKVNLPLKALFLLETQALDLRYLGCQPLRQMQNSPKLAILQSLDSMDAVQMGEVLKYIKGVLNTTNRTISYQTFKSEALKEIAQALKDEPTTTGMHQAA
jgi:hypothetical protein